MIARSVKDREQVWLQLDRSKRFAGAVVRFGPFGVRLKAGAVLRALADSSVPNPFGGAQGETRRPVSSLQFARRGVSGV
jgi:hypothetical protein